MEIDAVLAQGGPSLLLGAGNQGRKRTRREGEKSPSSLFGFSSRLVAALLSSPTAPGQCRLCRELEVPLLCCGGAWGVLLVSCQALAAPSGSSISCCNQAARGAGGSGERQDGDRACPGACDNSPSYLSQLGVGGEIMSRKYPS